MTKTARAALIRDIDARLMRLDLPDDVQNTVMAMIRVRRVPPTVSEDGQGDAPFVRIARGFYKISQRRTAMMGRRVAMDSVWNMLLDLFIAHGEGRSISVSSLCIASGGPPTTALRQIARLERDGFVIRYDDEHDGRRSWIRPTERALDVVRTCIVDCSAAIAG